MNSELEQICKEVFGYSEAEIAGLSEKQQKIIESRTLRKAYKIIIEVVKSANCACKPKIGDRYVMTPSGVVLPDECTFPLCLWALAPLLPISYVIYDRLSQGQDPNGHLFDHVRCTDTGVKCGGIGEVLFKVYCEHNL
jgi:uncharacterized repeat protein (TIGR04076 family)